MFSRELIFDGVHDGITLSEYFFLYEIQHVMALVNNGVGVNGAGCRGRRWREIA
jgi:hypothetical protein